MRDLADPVAMHKTLLSAFPSDLGASPRRTIELLYRVDYGKSGEALLVMQSRGRPDIARLPAGFFVDGGDDRLFDLGWAANPLVEPVDVSAIAPGARLRFRLRANPTRKILTKTGTEGTRTNGKRVPVRDETLLYGWLTRKGDGAGFRVVDARLTNETKTSGRRGNAKVTFVGARFDGVLEVIDVDRLRAALAGGIGSAKAFGFGLLSVAR
jgi:CRISPR system Cascade subunit CasE